MRIQVLTPAGVRSPVGTRITADRWGEILGSLGHSVRVNSALDEDAADVLICVHAVRSALDVERFAARPDRGAIVVALAGGEVAGLDWAHGVVARALVLADRIVAFHPAARARLSSSLRAKTRVLHASAARATEPSPPRAGSFEVCALGRLHQERDPLLAARATRLLPRASRLVVLHLGAALDDVLRRAAEQESRVNPHWVWLRERPHAEALMTLSRARAFLATGDSQGGSNALAEALAAQRPILAPRAPGNVALLGRDHPGLFPPGDARALADRLARLEGDGAFLEDLLRASRRRSRLVSATRERAAWRRLLGEVAPEIDLGGAPAALPGSGEVSASDAATRA